MKLHELLQESLIDSIKRKLGEIKGKVVTSVSSLLTIFKKNPEERLTTIETFKVIELSKSYEARVDTGALVCSLHADDIVVEDGNISFKHAGVAHKMKLHRMKEAKNANGVVNRPRCMMSYEWNGKTYHNIETSINDRSKMKFVLLVGRNLIKELKLPVHINDKDNGND
jgi:hypothetical protein